MCPSLTRNKMNQKALDRVQTSCNVIYILCNTAQDFLNTSTKVQLHRGCAWARAESKGHVPQWFPAPAFCTLTHANPPLSFLNSFSHVLYVIVLLCHWLPLDSSYLLAYLAFMSFFFVIFVLISLSCHQCFCCHLYIGFPGAHL